MSNNDSIRLAIVLIAATIIPTIYGIALVTIPLVVVATLLIINAKPWQSKKEEKIEQKIELLYKNYLH